MYKINDENYKKKMPRNIKKQFIVELCDAWIKFYFWCKYYVKKYKIFYKYLTQVIHHFHINTCQCMYLPLFVNYDVDQTIAF